MTTFTWAAATGNDWNTPADWSSGSVPDGSGADVLIALAGTYTVQISNGESFSVDSITLDGTQATLDVQGTLALAGATDSVFLDAGTLALDSGGTVAAGTIVADSGAVLAQGGVLSGVTYQGALTLAGSDQSLFIEDGLTLKTSTGGNSGSIDLSGASHTGISVLDSETLDNATLNFGGGLDDSLSSGTGNDSGNTLTLGSGFTIDISGGSDYLGYQAGALAVSDAGDALNNAGLISVGSGSLTVDYGTFTNTGSITVNGDLLIQSSATFDNAGTINTEAGSSNGLEISSGAFINTGEIIIGNGNGLNISPTTFINTGEILVGTSASLYLAPQSFTNTAGGTITIQSGSYVMMEGDFTTAQLDGITNDGTIRVDGTLDNAGQTLSVGLGTSLGTWNRICSSPGRVGRG